MEQVSRIQSYDSGLTFVLYVSRSLKYTKQLLYARRVQFDILSQYCFLGVSIICVLYTSTTLHTT